MVLGPVPGATGRASRAGNACRCQRRRRRRPRPRRPSRSARSAREESDGGALPSRRPDRHDRGSWRPAGGRGRGRGREAGTADDPGEEGNQGVALEIVPSKSNAATRRVGPEPRSQGQPAEDRVGEGGAAPTSRSASAAAPTRSRVPRPSPVTIALATCSGSVASGAASRPSVIFECTNPGRTTMTPDAGADEAVAQSLAERVEPRLARSVDEVRPAGPLAGDRRQHDDACRDPGAAVPRVAGTSTDTAPVKLVSTMRSASAASLSARSWSPSTPKATITRSMSPRCSKIESMNAGCDAWSSASNATDSTVVAPAWRSSLAGPENDSGSASRQDHRAAASGDQRLAVAMAMSDPPPRMRTDWTEPSASFMASSLSETEPAGEVRDDAVIRIESVAHCSPFGEAGVHALEVLGAGAGVLARDRPDRRRGAPSRRSGRGCGRAPRR